MKVLITGATGFIGRNLMRELEPDHELRLLDQARPEEATMFAGTTRLVAPFATDWPFVQADITDEEAMLAAMDGMDAVIHLAGEPRGLPEIGVATFRDNALGTFVAIDTARRAGARRFFCASSINAFGTFHWRLSGRPPGYAKLPLDEDFDPVPEDPYSLSKLVNEKTCAAYHRAYGMTTAAFRFAGVWSEERYREKLAEGPPPTEAWSDLLYQWVHVDDVVRGLRLALEAPDLPGFGVYTLAAADTQCPEPTMELLARFRPDLAATVDPPLEGRAPLLSIDRARRTFGYNPIRHLGP
ncbi:MAG: NAD(P)-dependent oxidoreductase [Spirochaetaceae bacterium]|nr:NAD(P)-dependent oxidoreductase [Spirochaetaceae bacterium]